MSNGQWVSSSMPYLTPRRPGSTDAWTAETTVANRRGSQRILHAGEAPAPPVVAELLGLSEGAPVVVRRRMMLLDGVPNELTDTYYPVAIARGTRLAETARIRGGAVTLLAELGHVGTTVREDVTARMPSAEERSVLETAADEPVLQLTRLTLDSRGRPVQVDLMTMPAHRQRLHYEIAIG
ncbi:hypothetical protein GCM10010218_31160 [Streptomyces mashuensis]|uniref:UbiC transcription regulator-associated domain-containing protein n=1 Tax=Streptomyces mashuensis TaxID=33904 RepID=A0A919B3C5_9ACTN|nr:UTRA domain-containing protein [Streptomyces mashuensis]GHF47532.1 hypothetical protein GCM10010218_31160 [Streptomyces mashuensis]